MPSQSLASQAYMLSRPLVVRAPKYDYRNTFKTLFSDAKKDRGESDERLVKLGKTALWTAPVAWGSVPIVGNVRIVIISERMVKKTSPSDSTPTTSAGHNRLVVRWKTEGANDGILPSDKTGKGASQAAEGDSALSRSEAGTNRGLSALLGGDAPIFQLRKEEHFMGLFIFSFDDEGQILDLKIEHAEDNDYRERPTGVSSLTDWLFGNTGMGVNHSPSPAMSVAIRRKR
ncbi:hypothetical protein KEM54_005351 [Ascosphaera aggregata]|nr:hypothetical protein KEM54_005351 [Ascosphaera aggregata]